MAPKIIAAWSAPQPTRGDPKALPALRQASGSANDRIDLARSQCADQSSSTSGSPSAPNALARAMRWAELVAVNSSGARSRPGRSSQVAAVLCASDRRRSAPGSRFTVMSDYIAARSVLVTGANRGLGLEIVKLLLRSSQPPTHLICVCREPAAAAELQALASQHDLIKIVQLDMTKYDEHQAFADAVEEIVADEGLNLFINCASRFPKDPQTLASTTAQGLTDSFSVNAIAPFLLTKVLLPLLRRAAAKSGGHGPVSLSPSRAAVINMSALMASISHTTSSYGYMFRSSKAALNMLTKCLSLDLSRDGILVVAIHPGWVQTDVGGTIALDQEQGAGMVLATIGHLTADDNGKFLNYKGETIPW